MFAFPDHLRIYELHDVTDRVRCAAPLASHGPEAAIPPC